MGSMAIYGDPDEIIDPQRWRSEAIDTVDTFVHCAMRQHFETPQEYAWGRARSEWEQLFQEWLEQQINELEIEES